VLCKLEFHNYFKTLDIKDVGFETLISRHFNLKEEEELRFFKYNFNGCGFLSDYKMLKCFNHLLMQFLIGDH
jgi:hypothetical protein